ncbi:MAG: YggT family protein [Syntrophomonadaceae bacterium]|nr:YggT family protein [Syntrophomonadaceae bacterium]
MYSLIGLVNLAFEIYVLIIVVRCVLSFFPHNPRQPIYKFFYDMTDPVLQPLQRYLPPMGPIDFTPLVAILLLMVLRSVVVFILSAF